MPPSACSSFTVRPFACASIATGRNRPGDARRGEEHVAEELAGLRRTLHPRSRRDSTQRAAAHPRSKSTRRADLRGARGRGAPSAALKPRLVIARHLPQLETPNSTASAFIAGAAAPLLTRRTSRLNSLNRRKASRIALSIQSSSLPKAPPPSLVRNTVCTPARAEFNMLLPEWLRRPLQARAEQAVPTPTG